MKTSDKIEIISKALVAAQPELSVAIKDSTNPHFKSKYADLTADWNACKDVLKEHKLAVIQTFSPENKEGTVLVTTRLIHQSGEWIEGELPMPHRDNNPQAVGSAITYARRYSLSAMLGIVTEEDDDGNSAAQEQYSKTIPKESENPKALYKKLLDKIEDESPLDPDAFLEGLRKQSEKIKAKTLLELQEKQVSYVLDNFQSILNKILDNQS